MDVLAFKRRLMRFIFHSSVILLALRIAAAQEITSPEKFFGFQLGADKKMARWDKIVEYYGVLEKQSGGRHEGRQHGADVRWATRSCMVIITSPANMPKLERCREINLQLSDPRGLTEAQAPRAGGRGQGDRRAVDEHARHRDRRHQMAPELAYDLLARKDEETRRILDNVIFIEVPVASIPTARSWSPTGTTRQLGTPYEGTNPPWLYQKYAGHDNNRDAFQTNIPDSQYMAKILFTRVEARGLRRSPPHGRQRRAHLPAAVRRARASLRRSDRLARAELVRRAHGLQRGRGAICPASSTAPSIPAGATSAFTGSRRSTTSPACSPSRPARAWPRRSSSIPISCAATRATCRYTERRRSSRIPGRAAGGDLRDIVERQKVSAWATLDLAARNRETVLWNAYLKGKRQTERGAAGKPAAYLISRLQHDPLTAIKMVNKLLGQGIEIQRATKILHHAAAA